MNKLTKVLAIAALGSSALIATSANAWWGPFSGDGFGSGDFSFHMSGRGSGYGAPYYGYGPYGYGAPGGA